MMAPNVILRAAGLSLAAFCLSLGAVASVSAQDVGADVGGGAGIFRAKNPETKKKPGTATKPAGRTAGPARTTRPSNIEERVEDLLDKGNEARDARKFADYSRHYKSCARPHKDSSSVLASTQRKEVIRCLMVQQGGRRGVFAGPKSHTDGHTFGR